MTTFSFQERRRARSIFGAANSIPQSLRLMRFLQQLGHVEQGLRRDAAAVEADAARVQLGIDEGDGHAEIGGEECSGVSTGTAADYCNIEGLIVRHGAFNHKGHEGTRRKTDSKFERVSGFLREPLCPSWFMCFSSLHRQQERLFKRFGNPAQEAGRVGAVNQAVIVRERERQNQARLELAVDPLRFHARARKAEDRHLRDDSRSE